MRVESVKTEEHRKGILVDGIPVLRGLLVKFMSGATAGSGATMANQPCLHAAFLRQVQGGAEVPFLRGLFADIDVAMKGRGMLAKHFDYDGQGSFFKTNVDILDLRGEDYVPDEPEHPLLLSLYAAYVGGKVEDGLAEAVGVAQGLQWVSTKLTLPADGLKAKLDLADVLDPIRGFLDLPTDRDIPLAKAMMPEDGKERDGLRPVTLLNSDEYEISFGVDSLSLMPGYEKEQRFVRTGSVITARRGKGWEAGKRDELAPFCASFSARSKNLWRGNDWQTVPVLRPEVQEAMRTAMATIAAAYAA